MIAIASGDRRIIASVGDTGFRTFLRSSAKPHQAIAVVASGAADRFDFQPRHLAIMAGSHSGDEIHVACVREILEKAGLNEGFLRCGIHPPFSRIAARALGADEPSVLQNNCSGKHAGMLAHAVFLGAPTENYLEPNHPVQRANASTLAAFAGLRDGSLTIGVDGCGAPVFGMTIESMALSWAALMFPGGISERLRLAADRVTQAMRSHPEMVGGNEGRIDTDIIRATGGRVLAKIGAEGVHTLGVAPTERYPAGLGIALKIEDGLGERARNVAAIEVLAQLGMLTREELELLGVYRHIDIRNHAGLKVGEVRAAFHVV